MTERKLASIRKIKKIEPIKGADRIVKAVVDGWELVTQKSNNFKPGDLVVYFEIDSLLPISEKFKFLEQYKVSAKNSVNGEGYRLKTIKLRGQISQGLILPLERIEGEEGWFLDIPGEDLWKVNEGDDVTETLEIKKYEKPIPAQLAGKIRGNFPSFLRKTDQERLQNLFDDRFYQEKILDNFYEVTLKLDGSSMTVYYNDGKFGVCSRNLDLLETEDNAFWQVARKLDLENKLAALGRNVAIQGELMGPGVQGNREKLEELDFFVFDMFDIDKHEYLNTLERRMFVKQLDLRHVPVLDVCQDFDGFMNIKDYLRYAERPSMNPDVQAEGIVFKNIKNPDISFKVISQTYLLQEE